MTVDTERDVPELAIVHGLPLDQEPGLGAMTLPNFLDEVANRFAEREALVEHLPDGSVNRWSYADLRERSRDVARALIACGVAKGTPVGVLMTNRAEWVSSCFGISMAGGIVVGLSTFSTGLELEHLLRESCVSVLLFERYVVAKDFAKILKELEPEIGMGVPGGLASPRFPFLRRLVALDDDKPNGSIEPWDVFINAGKCVADEIVDATTLSVTPADPALLFFSSGSTGKPKGILNSQRAVNIQSWRWRRIYAWNTPPRTWSANGLFWSGNFSIALGGTFAGGGALILQRTFVPAEALRLMELERVNLPYCWPHQWAQLEAEPSWPEANLSSFLYFDAEINLRRPQASISTVWRNPRASYGSTETFTISTAYSADTPEEIARDCNGKVLPGNTLKIIDPETGATLKREETGEIVVKGPTMMLGYRGIPLDQTLDSEGFYHTGDGGSIDKLGRLIFAGRINDIIKTGGANVSPVEIDWVLCTCPGVKVCKTTAVPHDTLGEMVVSLIVPEPDFTVSEQGITTFLKERLASYKVPRRVVFVTEIELNLTGTAKIKPVEARALAAHMLGIRQ